MVEITLALLVLAVAVYTIFGGADFGGGLLEGTLRRRRDLQEKLQATLGPVWEANHVWLIVVVVVLFVAFPKVYATVCTVLFVPLCLALLGIIFRGAFFTFRKYDPEPEARRHTYSFLFRASSILTPMMFGFIIAALLEPFPKAASDGSVDFPTLYIWPWLTVQGALCAVFVNALFGYLASVFFYGELDSDEDRTIIRRRIAGFFLATFVSGGAVLIWGVISDHVHPKASVDPIQLAAQAVAAACIPAIAWAVKHNRILIMRAAVALQVIAILSGWFNTQFPNFVTFTDGTELTVYNSAAPAVTLFWLNVGLVSVMSLVAPLLVYLYVVFRARPER